VFRRTIIAKIIKFNVEEDMNVNKLRRVWVLSVLIFAGLGMSCNEDDGQKSCNPEYVISASININLPLYSELETRGWTYVGGEGTGTKGIVVVKLTNGSYKAYDRNAPHICPTPNSQLEVIDDSKLHCPEDGAEWILLTGGPIENEDGFAPDRAPRVYAAVRTGSIINIYNQ